MSRSRIEAWALAGASGLALLPTAGGAWARLGRQKARLPWDWRRDAAPGLAKALQQAFGGGLQRAAWVALSLPDAWAEPSFEALEAGTETGAYKRSGLQGPLASLGLAVTRLGFRSFLSASAAPGLLRLHAHADGMSLLHTDSRGAVSLFRERPWKGKPAIAQAAKALLAESGAWRDNHPQWAPLALQLSGLEALGAQAPALQRALGLKADLRGLSPAVALVQRELDALEAA